MSVNQWGAVNSWEASAGDTTAPVITLTGGDTITLTVGDTYSDPEYTITDNVDATRTTGATITGVVDTSTAGIYTRTFNTTDAAGNAATSVVYTITVEEAAEGIQMKFLSKVVEAGSTVLLESTPMHTDSTITWTQEAGQAVTITGASSARATFTAMSDMTHEHVLVFKVTETKDFVTTEAYTYVTVLMAEDPSARILSLLAKARITLGDKAMDRYSDADLLLLLDEGQKDFCKSTKILKESIQVDIKDGEYLLPLPDDSWIVTRATYDGKKLPLLTYADVDNIVNKDCTNTLGLRDGWEDDVGEPKAIIYNKNNLGTVRLFPKPEDTYVELLNDPFGVLTEFSTVTSNDTVAVNAGVVSSVAEYKPLKVYVIKTSPEVTQDGPLVIPPMFDVALKYYIVAHSFLNDLDGGWQEKGLQQLRFYEREVEKAKDSEALNHTVNDSPSTYYRNGF